MRVLMWLGLALLVFFALRKQAKRGQAKQMTEEQARNTGGEQMLPCAVCQVFIPESEALMRHGQAFCCKDHAERGQ